MKSDIHDEFTNGIQKWESQTVEGVIAGMMRRKEKSKMTGDSTGASTPDQQATTVECDVCRCPITGYRCYCLSKCWSTVCKQCLDFTEHPSNHVVILLPDNFNGKPRFVAKQTKRLLKEFKSSKNTTDTIIPPLVLIVDIF